MPLCPCVLRLLPSAVTREEFDGLSRLVHQLDTLSSDVIDIFDYTDENASVSTVPGFKQDLISLYSDPKLARSDGLAFCMLSRVFLPKPHVIAAHIWKRAWHMACRKYMEFDVNDVRNGLLLFKPFEWAFDNSKICFISDGFVPGGGNYVMHILDDGIKDVGIVDKFVELEGLRNGVRGPYILTRPPPRVLPF